MQKQKEIIGRIWDNNNFHLFSQLKIEFIEIVKLSQAVYYTKSHYKQLSLQLCVKIVQIDKPIQILLTNVVCALIYTKLHVFYITQKTLFHVMYEKDNVFTVY